MFYSYFYSFSDILLTSFSFGISGSLLTLVYDCISKNKSYFYLIKIIKIISYNLFILIPKWVHNFLIEVIHIM
jgi:hypothetical protein